MAILQAKELASIGRRQHPPVPRPGLGNQQFRDLFTAHKADGLLDKPRDTLLIVQALQHLGVQAVQVSHQQRVGVGRVAELKGELILLVTHEIIEQCRAALLRCAQQVGHANVGQVTVHLLGGRILCRVMFAIHIAVIPGAAIVHAGEQRVERQWLPGMAFHARSASGPGQPRQVLILLAWRITADQRVYPTVPCSDATIEIPQGQVAVVAQTGADIPRTHMPDHQHVAPPHLLPRA